MSLDNSTIFTNTELEQLEETKKYRRRILEVAFQGENTPTDAKDVEAINSVLNSMDKMVMDQVNLRLKHQENQNKDAVLDAVSETLKAINSSKQRNAMNNNRELEIDNKLVPTDTVRGELDINPETISLTEIMEEEDK